MLAAYKGKSFFPSRIIEWLSWSEYSHVGWMTEQGTIIEAWSPKVREVASVNVGHQNGTEVDLFSCPSLCPCDQVRLEAWLRSQIGKPYDWVSVFRFIPRTASQVDQNGKWFCSELLMEAFSLVNVPALKRIPNYKVAPGVFVTSPIFEYVKTVKVGEANGY